MFEGWHSAHWVKMHLLSNKLDSGVPLSRRRNLTFAILKFKYYPLSTLHTHTTCMHTHTHITHAHRFLLKNKVSIILRIGMNIIVSITLMMKRNQQF